MLRHAPRAETLRAIRRDELRSDPYSCDCGTDRADETQDRYKGDVNGQRALLRRPAPAPQWQPRRMPECPACKRDRSWYKSFVGKARRAAAFWFEPWRQVRSAAP